MVLLKYLLDSHNDSTKKEKFSILGGQVKVRDNSFKYLIWAFPLQMVIEGDGNI